MFTTSQIVHGKVFGTFSVVKTKVSKVDGSTIVVVREVNPDNGQVSGKPMNFRADMFREFQG